MVITIRKNSTSYHRCLSCHLLYRTRALAQRCEDFCTAHKSCSLEIIKQAVKAE